MHYDYEVYVIDPNGGDKLLRGDLPLNLAVHWRARSERHYRGSGCRVEVWRDGEPVDTANPTMR